MTRPPRNTYRNGVRVKSVREILMPTRKALEDAVVEWRNALKAAKTHEECIALAERSDRKLIRLAGHIARARKKEGKK